MSRPNVTASIEHLGVTYTGTIDRSAKAEWPVTVATTTGLSGTGAWDGGIFGLGTYGDEGPSEGYAFPTDAITALDEALTKALRAAMRAS